MNAGLLDQGLTLMLVGMGTVFVFLTSLVIAMSVMSSLVNRFRAAPANGEPTEEEVAAITAAISMHRRTRP